MAGADVPRPREPSFSPAGRLAGLIQASHPFPIAMVVSLTLLLGLASAAGEVDGSRLGLALVSMLCSQLAIGWSNDYLDRERDARFQPEKPVPSGLVKASALFVLAALALAVSVTVAAALGPAVLGWLLAGTACGFAYNLRFKDSPLSWAPYVVAFAILPPFVWSALDAYRREFLWLYAVGAPLAVAAHLANSLPDIETDAAAGSAGLAVRLGRTGALALLYACLLAPVAIIIASLTWLSYDSTLLAATLACYGGLVLASRFAYGLRPLRRGAALGFRLIAPAAVILAAGWLAAL